MKLHPRARRVLEDINKHMVLPLALDAVPVLEGVSAYVEKGGCGPRRTYALQILEDHAFNACFDHTAAGVLLLWYFCRNAGEQRRKLI